MEDISTGFILTLAHRFGYYNSGGRDYGTDLKICESSREAKPSGDGYFIYETGVQVHIQVKSTTESQVTFMKNGLISYDLDVDNYNMLVKRNQSILRPMYLVLFLFPDDHDDWVAIDVDKMVIKKCAYWWRPDSSHLQSVNKNTVAVHISPLNTLNLDFFPRLFKEMQ